MKGLPPSVWGSWQRTIWLLLLCGFVACKSVTLASPEASSALVFTATPLPLPPTLAAAAPAPSAAPDAAPFPTVPPPPTATATPHPLPTRQPPPLINPPDASLEALAAQMYVPLTVLDATNTGRWAYDAQTFIHPLSLEVAGDTAYLLDAGRVLSLSLSAPQPPHILQQPGDTVAGVQVLEPLDLSLTADGLLVLDRAGDVYHYAAGAAPPVTATWTMDRYDRPERPSSGSHYFVAIAGTMNPEGGNGRFLLETNYAYALHYTSSAAQPTQQLLWMLPPSRAVDIDTLDNDPLAPTTYILRQDQEDDTGTLTCYQGGRELTRFQPNISFWQVRQVVATETQIYVLDHDGRRLLTLDTGTGQLLAIFQPPPEIGAIWANEAQLILAGRDHLYFVHQPERLAWAVPLNSAEVETGITLPGTPRQPQPHDPAILSHLPPLRLPLGVSLPASDLQLPGAPRHYRLGVHEGIDLYWAQGSPVTAVADGTVTRATLDYTDPTPAEFAAWYYQTHELGYSSVEALDFYRGRQVWLTHPQGLRSSYVHLDSIDWQITVGTAVSQGQVVGTVGNSGSPSSQVDGRPDTHLHLDLWIGDHYIGEFLRPVETRDWLERLFNLQ